MKHISMYETYIIKCMRFIVIFASSFFSTIKSKIPKIYYTRDKKIRPSSLMSDLSQHQQREILILLKQQKMIRLLNLLGTFVAVICIHVQCSNNYLIFMKGGSNICLNSTCNANISKKFEAYSYLCCFIPLNCDANF